MSSLRIATRYAKSLIDLSKEKNQLELVYADMKYLQAICHVSAEFVNILRSPIIHSDKKRAIITAITKNKLTELTNLFTNLLVTKGREGDLPEVVNAYINQYNEIKGIQQVKLTTAIEISEDAKNDIIAKIKAAKNFGTVELETKINSNIIGGFILEFNNNYIDASIARDLKDIKKQFTKNVFVKSIR